MIVPGSLNPHFLGGRLIMNLVISANTADYNLRSAAIAAGWDGVTALDLTCTVNSGVRVYSSSTGILAFDVGSSWPIGTSIHVINNNGFIQGMGGAGGQGGNGAFNVYKSGSPGYAGGPALGTTVAISVTNNGTIGGGGGGGGGGAARLSYNGGNTTNGAAGPGGGGGQGNALGGPAGPNNSSSVDAPVAGTAATLTAAGVGGPAVLDSDEANYSGAGGNGGTLGQSGSPGTLATNSDGGLWPGGAGGPAGAAVIGNANITWLVTGTRLGALT